MRTKWWKRRAGCWLIELPLAAGLWASAPEYRAGVVTYGSAKALALEDRAGARAVIAQAGFSVTLEISDLAAARLIEAYGLDRGSILLLGAAPGGPSVNTGVAANELATAAAAALGHLEAARLTVNGDFFSILGEGGRCVGVLRAASLDLSGTGCAEGKTVRSPIRPAFRVIEFRQPLIGRDAVTRSYPVQAIALGKELALLGLGGDAPLAEFRAEGRIAFQHANDDVSPTDLAALKAAVREVLARVGR
jgi:hypothetical protein